MCLNKCNQECKCCKPKLPCSSTVTSVNSSAVTYNGEDLSCTGVATNTNLNSVLEALDTAICNIPDTIENSNTIVNIGDGEGVYAGTNNLGQKTLKGLKEGDGVIISSTSTDIRFDIDPDYIKLNAGGLIFENIVEFNTANPNSGSPVFDPNQPQEDDILYWSSVDNTNWKWNGTAYVLAAANPNSTAWYLSDTLNDAGGNKAADIVRRGAIGIGVTEASASIHTAQGIRQGNVLSSIIKADADGDLVAAIAGTDFLTPTGSAAGLTGFPTLNQNTTGNAATVTTNANLSGDVTSVGNVTTLSTTGVVAGTYSNPTITVDAKGRATNIVSGGGGRTLRDFYAETSNATNTLTDLYSYTIPTNTLVANGDKIEAFYAGRTTNGTSKDLIITVGSNSHLFKTSVDGSFTIKVNMIRTGTSGVNFSMETIAATAQDVFADQWTITGWNAPQALIFSSQATNTGDTTAIIGVIKYVPAAT